MQSNDMSLSLINLQSINKLNEKYHELEKRCEALERKNEALEEKIELLETKKGAAPEIPVMKIPSVVT